MWLCPETAERLQADLGMALAGGKYPASFCQRACRVLAFIFGGTCSAEPPASAWPEAVHRPLAEAAWFVRRAKARKAEAKADWHARKAAAKAAAKGTARADAAYGRKAMGEPAMPTAKPVPAAAKPVPEAGSREEYAVLRTAQARVAACQMAAALDAAGYGALAAARRAEKRAGDLKAAEAMADHEAETARAEGKRFGAAKRAAVVAHWMAVLGYAEAGHAG